jgi:hypothetical protein
MTDMNPQDLADQYIAQWTEPDPGERRKAIERLWAQDGAHLLAPPVEIREVAAGLGFDHTTLEAHGHDAIELRIRRSHERFVASGEYTFRSRGDAVRLHEIVKFGWDTVSAEDGTVVGGGVDVLVLDADGRITTDYMFPE